MNTQINHLKTRKNNSYPLDFKLKAFALPAGIFLIWVILFQTIPLFVFFILLLPFLFRQAYYGFMVKYIDIDVDKIDDTNQINKHTLRLDTDDGEMRLNNPFSGIMVIGGAGSGKSASLAKPLLREFAKGSYHGLLYDYKGDLTDYTKVAYNEYSKKEALFHVIDFRPGGFTHSTPINPISRRYIQSVTDATNAAMIILQNLDKDFKEDFWNLSAQSLLTACIYACSRAREPHNIDNFTGLLELIQTPIESLLDMLSPIPQIRSHVSAIKDAYDAGASSQLAGVIGTLKNKMARLADDDILKYFVSDDVNLNINESDDGKLSNILAIIPDTQKMDVLRPFIALVTNICLKKMNTAGREPSFVMLDELPTLYIHNLQEIPNTARSNKIATVVMCQDNSQVKSAYGKYADTILSAFQNKFFGRTTSPETAEYASKIFGEDEFLSTTTSSNRSLIPIPSFLKRKSYSRSYQKKALLEPRIFRELPKGGFAHICDSTNFDDDVNYFYMAEDIKDGEISPDVYAMKIRENYKNMLKAQHYSDDIPTVDDLRKRYDMFRRLLKSEIESKEEPKAQPKEEPKAQPKEEPKEEPQKDSLDDILKMFS